MIFGAIDFDVNNALEFRVWLGMCGIKDRRNAHAIRIKITRRESLELEEYRERVRGRMMGVYEMV
jgi:hypothetical protein